MSRQEQSSRSHGGHVSDVGAQKNFDRKASDLPRYSMKAVPPADRRMGIFCEHGDVAPKRLAVVSRDAVVTWDGDKIRYPLRYPEMSLYCDRCRTEWTVSRDLLRERVDGRSGLGRVAVAEIGRSHLDEGPPNG